MVKEQQGKWVVPNPQIPRSFGIMNIVFGALMLFTAAGYGAWYLYAPTFSRNMQARMKNPATTMPGAYDALQALHKAIEKGGVPRVTLELMNLRASQINGCSVCVDIHSRELELCGESSERIHLVAAWREAPYFSDAERAALALTEAATRMADRPDPVPDEVWDEAARHYTEPQLAALVVAIAAINAFNRVNFYAPDGNLTDSTFGVISATLPPRDIQMGLKLYW